MAGLVPPFTPIVILEVLEQPDTQIVITSAARGPQGDPGTAGASGSVGVTFVQAIPSASWLITHNLGYLPNVTVYDDAGDECDVTILATATTVTVIGAGAFSGTARLI